MKLKWRLPAVAFALALCFLFYLSFIDPSGHGAGTRTIEGNVPHLSRQRSLVDKSNFHSNHSSLESDRKAGIARGRLSSRVPEDVRRKFMFKSKHTSPAENEISYTNLVFTKDRRDPELFSDVTSMDEAALMKRIAIYRHKARFSGKTMDVFDDEVVKNRRSDLRPWERWYLNMSQYELYRWDDGAIDELLVGLQEEDVVESEQLTGGTQLKMKFTFKNELQALFKPMRFPRDVETLPDHFYFSDFERHHSEIAAFHLDRIMGFRRCPPVAGRVINITTDIEQHASSKFKKTIFISPAGNKCFFGKCSYYCDTNHAICGHPDWLEGSLAAFLPPDDVAPRDHVRNPWRRSYSKFDKADWETDPGYCSKVKQEEPFNDGRTLFDLIDLTIFDFLQGNMDRHHYEIFSFPDEWGNDTVPLVLDNGRGFGKQHHDEMSILAPLYQCCRVRYSTLQKLLLFDEGPMPLSHLMRKSLARDSTYPVLTDAHLAALDRRVKKTLVELQKCILASSWETVVIDDGF